MGSLEKSLNWRLVYTVCCVIYAGCVLYLSQSNFEMVHKHYRKAGERLHPESIREIAYQELVEKCRVKLKRAGRIKSKGDLQAAGDDLCLSWPEPMLADRVKAVEKHLVEEKSRASRKLVMFYVSFVLVFLLLPMAFVYMLVAFLIWLYRNIKFVE